MATIQIHTRIESETVTLPELRAMVGRDVKITVEEETPADRKDFLAALDALRGIDFDEEAFWRLREVSKI